MRKLPRRTLASASVAALALLFFLGRCWFNREFGRSQLPAGIEWSDPASPPNSPPAPIFPDPPADFTGDGLRVVLWISIPGFRSDYIKNSGSPFFSQLIAEGFSTDRMTPNFPCLTFPAHAALATGAPAESHGIPADRFRLESGEIIDHPLDSGLFRAEPIWTTATRQGVRTLVHDWPLSQVQPGEHASAYFLERYDPRSSDRERLEELWRTWSNDRHSHGLRLLMIRLDDIQKAGMNHGPRSDRTHEAVSETGRNLRDFLGTIGEYWAELASANSRLTLIITTDHGMTDRDKNINLPHLMEEEIGRHLEILAHDGIGHLFFKDLPEDPDSRRKTISRIDDQLRRRVYFRTYPSDQLPARWRYYIPGRTGDRVLTLRRGYAFVDQIADEPLFSPEPGQFSAFGFPAEESARMSGPAIIWHWPPAEIDEPDLGEIDFLPFHGTACKLLGIDPAASAAMITLPVD